MSEQARIETAIDTAIDNCELFRAQIAERAREIAALTPNPSAVVLPERLATFHDDDPGRVAFSRTWNACLREVARLNPSRGVPDGYRLVPVEPTPEMIDCFWGEITQGDAEIAVALEAYAEMLSAAPTPAPTVEPARSDDHVEDDLTMVKVPRELLRTIEQSWRIPNGCPASVSEEVGEIIANGLRDLRALLNGGRHE
ncbi:hypothetical protein [uncultured Pseudomonas sp.]|uniref:hypothetical protein n=1 Tax=uncultured Pseudomonas sp. TaxID=114707 RepID=UPI00262820C1|nr:hypothetical protein [uncultured Pseudomonas sp.]